jgi:phosphoglycerol transferase MdoB-like AlkP superfamily enzyme
MKHLRKQEYLVFFYRLFLAYFFYFIARVLFYIFNKDLLNIDSFSELVNVFYRGFAFDTTAILYVNALFTLFSLLPLFVNTNKKYQKVLFYVYFIPNLIAYATNFIDMIYYRFSNFRLTMTTFDEFKNETNGNALLLSFLKDYWYILILFLATSALWIYLYKKVTVKSFKATNKVAYISISIIVLLIIATLMVGGIRGDFKHSTRPITLVDANRHVTKKEQAVLVLNTPFTIIRTFNKREFKNPNFFKPEDITKYIKPIKQYHTKDTIKQKPNIVLFIIESYGREYISSLNKRRKIKDYQGYAPFFDSLIQHSWAFDNAYANGRKSIHGMSSVLAGIPSYKVAFTSSAYSNQKIQSLISTLKEEGYDTSFFHGAANGSMGFLGFSNILGIDHYYGKTEFNDDSKSDGVWGIWDEYFFQYIADELDKKKEPFFAAIFTLSSHAPYHLPKEYEGKFPVGHKPVHKMVGYTDMAFKKFFNRVKKSPWYNNTIFVFTADHTNQKYYELYRKGINRTAVPIIFFKPDNSLAKLDTVVAQQIDIYPTLLDMIGYDKPFRSWGRSLLSKKEEPFAITHSGNVYFYIKDDLICTFDGKKAVGFYKKSDEMLQHNLIDHKTPEMEKMENECKAYVQDYMDRIVNKKLVLSKK